MGENFLILFTSHHFCNNTQPNLQTKVNLTHLRSKHIKQLTYHAIPSRDGLQGSTSRLQTLLSHVRVIAGDPNWDQAHAIEDHDNMALGLDRNDPNYIYIISTLPKNSIEFRIWIGEATACAQNSINDMLAHVDKVLIRDSIDQLLSKGNSKLLWLDPPSKDFSDSEILDSLQLVFSKHAIRVLGHWDDCTPFRSDQSMTISLRVGRKKFNYSFKCTNFLQPL